MKEGNTPTIAISNEQALDAIAELALNVKVDTINFFNFVRSIYNVLDRTEISKRLTPKRSREIRYKTKNKEKAGKKEVDRRGYKLIQVNSLALDRGDDEEGKTCIVILSHSDKEKITGITGVDTEAEIINAISSLLNGWITLNKKRFEERGEWK